MGDNFIKFLIYGIVLTLIVALLTNPDVLTDYSDRLYVATLSEPYRASAHKMFQINRQVTQTQQAYERHQLDKPTTRTRLLGFYDQYERLVYVLSQSSFNPSDRDELIARSRGLQNAINRWGVERGF